MTLMTAEAETTPSPSDTPSGVFPLAHDSRFTVDDLEAMPDDGNRYELIDGAILVSPAPGRRHQRVVLELYGILRAACSDGLDVTAAPFSVRTSETTEVQPDVLVARDEDFTDKLLPAAPLLAVEVISPSSTIIDRHSKKAVYQRMGVQSYWLIDSESPSLTVLELDEQGVYQETAVVKGDEPFDATNPYQVRVVLTDLLGDLAP